MLYVTTNEPEKRKLTQHVQRHLFNSFNIESPNIYNSTINIFIVPFIFNKLDVGNIVMLLLNLENVMTINTANNQLVM